MLKNRIYIDMDGVLVDAMKGMEKVSKGKINKHSARKLLNETCSWLELMENDPDFWFHLDWMPEGRELWKFVSKYNPTILSAFPSADEKHGIEIVRKMSMDGKLRWVEKHLGKHACKNAILCRKDEKQLFARDNILIDDYRKNIEQWVENGGIGVLHNTTTETIYELKEIERWSR